MKEMSRRMMKYKRKKNRSEEKSSGERVKQRGEREIKDNESVARKNEKKRGAGEREKKKNQVKSNKSIHIPDSYVVLSHFHKYTSQAKHTLSARPFSGPYLFTSFLR